MRRMERRGKGERRRKMGGEMRGKGARKEREREVRI